MECTEFFFQVNLNAECRELERKLSAISSRRRKKQPRRGRWHRCK